ncbi:MAG: phosphoribosylformimino-5-aminoimidazole carboxamide ribotide isomerase [Methanosarcinaceae archaeon]|nr:phosphoribosylformimino-5-aminoimidazole carboxamide ribotide isomerase [Methanosarcinaceae archaeon]
MFRIIFVLDIYNRNVVHAQGGNRKEYQPVHITSKICTSSDPFEVIDSVKPAEVYIADLNILQGVGAHETNFDVIRSVSQRTKTMVDPGISTLSDVQEALLIADTVILGTETASMETIAGAVSEFPGRVNVSIDKKNGRILTRDSHMPDDPFKIVEILNDMDIRDIIILDMDRVGTSSGVDAQFLSKIASKSTHDVLLGGGVRDMADIESLKKIVIKGALVATALHNGSIPLALIH